MRTRRAFALSIVLWIVAILMLGVAFFLAFAKDEVKLSAALSDKLQTQLHAQSILELTKYYLMAATIKPNYLEFDLQTNEYRFPQQLFLDASEYNLSQNAKISIEDISGHLNLNLLSGNFIAKYLTQSIFTGEISQIQDSFDDWVDKDMIVRFRGAEKMNYESNDVAYLPRDYKGLQSFEELLLIEGVQSTISQERLDALRERFIYADNYQWNIYHIDALTMHLLLDIDLDDATSLIALRHDPLTYRQKLKEFPNYDSDNFMIFPSGQYNITIEVHQNGARSVLQTQLHYEIDSDEQEDVFKILSYRLF